MKRKSLLCQRLPRKLLKRKLKEEKMVKYACFNCNKRIAEDLMGKRVRCPYCGSKILFKPRTTITKVKAV